MHGLDPRTKVACALAVSVAAFAIGTPAQLAVAVAGLLAAILVSRVGVWRVLRSMSPVAATLAALAVVNLLVVRVGDVVWRLGPVVVTQGGLSAAALFPSRMAVGAAAFGLLLLTTTPSRLTDALDATLAPLSRLGLPGHELAMVFSLMLRFVPILAEEARNVIDAQAIRGAGIGEGSPARRLRSVTPALVALLAASLRHAERLSRALDARCYEGGAARSHWHPLRMGARDAVAAALCALLVAGIVLAR